MGDQRVLRVRQNAGSAPGARTVRASNPANADPRAENVEQPESAPRVVGSSLRAGG